MADQITRQAKPADFDWVTTRHKCSLVQMFEAMKVMAERNVATRNALIAGGGRTVCSFSTQSTDVFVVTGFGRGVSFCLCPDSIDVQSDQDTVTHLTLTLTDSADCKLKLGDDNLEPWQVMRRFLEPVLFFTPNQRGL